MVYASVAETSLGSCCFSSSSILCCLSISRPFCLSALSFSLSREIVELAAGTRFVISFRSSSVTFLGSSISNVFPIPLEKSSNILGKFPTREGLI